MAKAGDLTNSTAALLKEHGLRGCLELVANWTAPYTSPAVLDELRGLAQGSGVDYDMLLHIHLFPEFIEVRSHTPVHPHPSPLGCSLACCCRSSAVPTCASCRFGPLRWLRVQASCSIVSAFGPATATGHLMQARALDWDVSGPLQVRAMRSRNHPCAVAAATDIACGPCCRITRFCWCTTRPARQHPRNSCSCVRARVGVWAGTRACPRACECVCPCAT